MGEATARRRPRRRVDPVNDAPEPTAERDHPYEGTRDVLQVDILETYPGEWSPCDVCGRPISEHQHRT